MDYSRPPPPQPGSRSIVGRVSRQNLRPVVISFGCIATLWSFLAAIGNFRAIGGDNAALTNISIALGALYTALLLIELFGIYAAASQRIPFIRIFSLLSIAGGVLAVGASLVSTVVHFVFKKDLLSECTEGAEGAVVRYRYGWFGQTTHEVLDKDGAIAWCNDAWNRGSYSEIFTLLFVILLSVFFSVVALGYYRQVLDPAHPTNSWRAPSNQIRTGAQQNPAHYSPYNPNLPTGYSAPNLGYDAQPAYQPGGASSQYAPPPGPPPPRSLGDDGDKPPGYLGSAQFDGYGVGKDAKELDDPFGDFDARKPDGERDLTSRPTPGGTDRFL